MTAATSETTFIQVAGRKTELLKGGDGPPLLYLHSAAGETDWLPFHEGLAQRFTVYAPAHPGFSASEGLEEIRDIHDYAWHYVDLLDVLGLEQVPIVGFSLGAWIAAELALLRPERVRRMVLTAAAGLHVPDAPVAELFIDDLEDLRELLFYNPSDLETVERAMPLSLEDSRILQWLKAREATARVGWNPYMHDPKLVGHLHRITCPILILWGRHDKLLPLRHGEVYAEKLPHAELTVLEDCGHMVPFEKMEQFVSTCLAFCSCVGVSE